MEWYALYGDGQLIAVQKWHGVPEVKDFGIPLLTSVEWQVKEVVLASSGSWGDGKRCIDKLQIPTSILPQ